MPPFFFLSRLVSDGTLIKLAQCDTKLLSLLAHLQLLLKDVFLEGDNDR